MVEQIERSNIDPDVGLVLFAISLGIVLWSLWKVRRYMRGR